MIVNCQLVGRRKMCEYANTLEDEVTSLRKSEQEMRSELERVHKVMSSISTPAFLEGVKPCQTIPDTKLCGPLFTLHQMLTSSAREFPGWYIATQIFFSSSDLTLILVRRQIGGAT